MKVELEFILNSRYKNFEIIDLSHNIFFKIQSKTLSNFLYFMLRSEEIPMLITNEEENVDTESFQYTKMSSNGVKR